MSDTDKSTVSENAFEQSGTSPTPADVPPNGDGVIETPPRGIFLYPDGTPVPPILNPLGRPYRSVTKPEDLTRILSIPDIPTPWLFLNLLVAGCFHIFAGEPESMKSFFALFLAYALSTGAEVFGSKNPVMPVIYIDRENPSGMVRGRAKTLKIEDDRNLHYWGLWEDSEPPAFSDPRLLAWAKALKPFFVFDSLVDFHDADENKASEMAAVLKPLRDLCTAGATVALLHHQGKKGIEGHSSPFRGSSQIHAACDIAFNIKKTEEGQSGTRLDITSFKNRYGTKIEHTVRFDPANGLFVLVPPSITAPGNLDQKEVDQVAAVILASPGIGVDEIKEKTELGAASLRGVLEKYDKKMWQRKTGAHGKFMYYPIQTAPELSASQLGVPKEPAESENLGAAD